MDFKYEVAFSFCQQDEGVAYQVNDLIQDRLKTFIYSQQQKILVGRDGEKAFGEIFSKNARIVVVLYRKEWGITPWTRIEHDSIRNRGFEKGYDFTIFVKLDDSPMPEWLGKRYLYHNMERFGFDGLGAVIELKLQEAGGEVRVESLLDQVDRSKREIISQRERKEYLSSTDAFMNANQEFVHLYNLVNETVKAIEDNESELYFSYDMRPKRFIAISHDKLSLRFSWTTKFTNSLHESTLEVSLGLRQQTTVAQYDRDEIRQLQRGEYLFDRQIGTNQFGWSLLKNEKEFYITDQLVTIWLKIFIEKVKTRIIAKQRLW